MPVSAHLPALVRHAPGLLRALGLAGAAALCASRLAGAQDPEGTALVLVSDGQLLRGTPSITTGTLSIGAGSTTVERIIDCQFSGSRLHWLDQGVILADGQVLRGAVHEFQNGELAFACDLLGEQKIPATTLGAIVLSPVNAGRPLEAASAEPGRCRVPKVLSRLAPSSVRELTVAHRRSPLVSCTQVPDCGTQLRRMTRRMRSRGMVRTRLPTVMPTAFWSTKLT